MKAITFRFLVLIILGFSVVSCIQKKSKNETIRIGYMPTFATAGQVVSALKNTDILKEEGLNVDFKAFEFGPPMNEAAISGQLDITVVGDMPAIYLVSKSNGKWKIISKSIHFPVTLVVRKDLKATSIEDLKGDTIGVPFGSGPQPTLYAWLEEAGLKIGKDVYVVNVTPTGMAEAIQTKSVHALMSWEPTVSVLLKKDLAYTLKEGVSIGMMTASEEFIEKNPDLVKKFLLAWKKSIIYVNKNAEQVNSWYSTDSRIPVEILNNIKVVDDNFTKSEVGQINIKLTEEDIKVNQRKAEFALTQKLLNKPLNLKDHINQDFSE